MTTKCHKCRWDLRHHGAGDGAGCNPGVPLSATADELWEWLVGVPGSSRIEVQHCRSERGDVVDVYCVLHANGARVTQQREPTLSAVLRAVCAEVMSK